MIYAVNNSADAVMNGTADRMEENYGRQFSGITSASYR